MTNQQEIYNAVALRGYSPNGLNLTPQQYAVRQMAKVAEEAIEALQAANFPGVEELPQLERDFKSLFDDIRLWRDCEVDAARLLRELPDVAIPTFTAAQALGTDLGQLSINKASSDIKRGLR